MLTLKDTDTDDLFRRASDKYPLRTDSADWDKMAAALDRDPAPGEFDGTDGSDRRRNRRLFWLLLFLPLGGAGYYALHRIGNGSSHPMTVVSASGAGEKGSTGAKEVSPAGGETGSATPSRSAAGGQRSTGTPANAAGEQAATATSVNAAGGQAAAATSANAARGQAGIAIPAHTAGGTAATASSANAGLRGQETGAGPVTASTGRHRNTVAPGSGNGSGETSGFGKGSGETGGFIAEKPFTLRWAGDMRLARLTDDYLLSVNVTAPTSPKNSDPAKQKPAKAKSARYFYAGIIAAPDISTVKMQSVKGVGNTFGILLGYAINSRWSIETGAYLESKKYYTDGEYFNTEKVRLPNYSKLLNVDGTCYMWEIPLNVRYNFNPGGKTKWFGMAGFSTYLMSRENYTYTYKKSGLPHDSTWNIKQPSQYPFSIVNLSAGFEQRLGRVGSLRVEPYLRLPLAGIGTGKLPIMSAGINIGITRRLW